MIEKNGNRTLMTFIMRFQFFWTVETRFQIKPLKFELNFEKTVKI